MMVQSIPHRFLLPTRDPHPVPALVSADGFGPSRRSLTGLLIIIPCLILGLTLGLLGLRLRRFSSVFSLAAAPAFLAWTITVNLMGVGGLTGTGSAEWRQNLAIWAVVASAGLLGTLFGLLLGSRVCLLGSSLFAIEAGVVFGSSIQLMGDNLTLHPDSLLWAVMGVFAFVFWTIHFRLFPDRGFALSSATMGSFLFWLAIDLIVNELRGFSLGWRMLYDHNRIHALALSSYHPPPSTRVFLGVSWLIIPLLVAFQFWIYTPIPSILEPDVHENVGPGSVSGGDKVINALERGISPQGTSDTLTIRTLSRNPSQRFDKAKSGEGIQAALGTQSGTKNSLETDKEMSSDPNTTITSQDTGLSAIPELSEHSRTDSNGTRGRASRSGSGSARGGLITNSHRHPSNATSASVRRSTQSSDQPPFLPGSPILSASTSSSEGGVAPDDSISQTGWRRLAVVPPDNIDEETETIAPLSSVDLIMSGGLSVSSYLEGAYEMQRTDVALPNPEVTPEEAMEDLVLSSDLREWTPVPEGRRDEERQVEPSMRRDLHSLSESVENQIEP